MPTYSANQLRVLARDIFVAESATESNAKTVASLLVRANLFSSPDIFRKRVGEVVRRIKTSKLAPGFREILIPGEPEFLSEEKLSEGIAVEDNTINKISETANRLHVKMPEPLTK